MSDRSTKISKLKENKRYRAAYIRAKLNTLVPSQIRALRLRFFNTQKALAEEAEMKQSRISAMERPGAVQFNLDTLVRLAAAFKVALVVEFVSFSEMLRWENGFSQDVFNVITIDNDHDFIAPAVAGAQEIVGQTEEAGLLPSLDAKLPELGSAAVANQAAVREGVNPYCSVSSTPRLRPPHSPSARSAGMDPSWAAGGAAERNLGAAASASSIVA